MDDEWKLNLVEYFEAERSRIASRSEFRVAVTGHRMNRMTVDTYKNVSTVVSALLLDLNNMLEQLASSSKAQLTDAQPLTRVVISALAEGADRVVALQGLALGWELDVILPFSSEEYQNDFETKSSKLEFTQLLDAARNVNELANMRNQSDLTGYEAAGNAIIEEVDLLIAIWDGLAVNGPGGTAEVVSLAQKDGIPVVWIHFERPHKVELI